MAYDFTGGLTGTDRIVFADHANYDFTSDFALALWVNLDSFNVSNQFDTLVSKNGNYILRFEGTGGVGADGKLNFLWWDNTDILFFALTTAPGLAAWHHLIIQVTANVPVKFYLDGVDSAASGGTAAATVSRDLTNALALGGEVAGGGAAGLDGRLAALGLYNVTLTSQERADLAAGYVPAIVRPADLKADIPLLDNANDVTNSQTGTVTGATVVAGPPLLYSFARRRSATLLGVS